MAHTIIIPLSDPQQDENGIAERAIGSARVLNDSADAPIVLVSAIDDEMSRTTRQAYLDHIAGTIGGNVSTEVACGDPGNVILETAARLRDPVIVMASHGRRGVQRRVLGSTAAAVARNASCPVLILPASPSVPSRPAARVERVLLPMNDAAIADAFSSATVAILGVERVQEIKFYLVEVTPSIPPQPALTDGDRFQDAYEIPAHFLRRVAQRLTEQGVHATWSLRIGEPARELTRLVHEEAIDLIAMPAYSRSGVNHLVPAVIAELVRSSRPVPVLLIPEIAMAQVIWTTLAVSNRSL